MKRILYVTIALALSVTVGRAQDEGADLFVHPFFSHMALADPVGEASFRLTAMQRRAGEAAGGDFGLHIEAGLLPGLGIHIRNDAIKSEPFSEIMLMYNVLTSSDQNYGASVFGQLSIPTGTEASSNVYKGLFGIGLKAALPPTAVFNGDIHYDARDNMAEYEDSVVFRASEFLYPIIEARGEIMPDGTSAYVLTGLKFRIGEHQAVGVGFQIGVSRVREYDVEPLIQYGFEL